MFDGKHATDKEYFFHKARGYLISGVAVGVLAVIGSLALMIWSEYTAIAQMFLIISIAWIAVSFIRYYVRSEDDLEIIIATCVDRRRIGYRKQYFEYTFNIVSPNQDATPEGEATNTAGSFEMKSATKEKFKKDLTYLICFKKSKIETSVKYNSNLICFELYNK